MVAAAAGQKRKAKADTTTVKKEVEHVDKALAKKAVTALLQYHEKQSQDKNNLLGNDRPIQVQFGLNKASNDPKFKPIRIMIPHPIHRVAEGKESEDVGVEDPDVCLIVKDSAKEWIQELLQELSTEESLKCVKKVIGLEGLRKKYSRYHQRRELLNQYSVFMADDRILPMLTSALGKDFVKAKKLPLPIRITKTGLPFAIHNNLAATFLTISSGTSVSVRVGNTGMPPQKLVENVLAVAERAGSKLPKGAWDNIRSIAIKTPESTSLPIYHQLSQELQAIADEAGVPQQQQEVVSKDDKKKKQKKAKDAPQSEDAKDNKEKEEVEKPDASAAAKSPLVQALKKRKTGSAVKKEKKKKSKKTRKSV